MSNTGILPFFCFQCSDMFEASAGTALCPMCGDGFIQQQSPRLASRHLSNQRTSSRHVFRSPEQMQVPRRHTHRTHRTHHSGRQEEQGDLFEEFMTPSLFDRFPDPQAAVADLAPFGPTSPPNYATALSQRQRRQQQQRRTSLLHPATTQQAHHDHVRGEGNRGTPATTGNTLLPERDPSSSPETSSRSQHASHASSVGLSVNAEPFYPASFAAVRREHQHQTPARSAMYMPPHVYPSPPDYFAQPLPPLSIPPIPSVFGPWVPAMTNFTAHHTHHQYLHPQHNHMQQQQQQLHTGGMPWYCPFAAETTGDAPSSSTSNNNKNSTSNNNKNSSSSSSNNNSSSSSRSRRSDSSPLQTHRHAVPAIGRFQPSPYESTLLPSSSRSTPNSQNTASTQHTGNAQSTSATDNSTSTPTSNPPAPRSLPLPTFSSSSSMPHVLHHLQPHPLSAVSPQGHYNYPNRRPPLQRNLRHLGAGLSLPAHSMHPSSSALSPLGWQFPLLPDLAHEMNEGHIDHPLSPSPRVLSRATRQRRLRAFRSRQLEERRRTPVELVFNVPVEGPNLISSFADTLRVLLGAAVGSPFEEQSTASLVKDAKDICPSVKAPTHERLNKEACAICFVEFEAEEALRVLPCKHIYHAECVDQWWETNVSCPKCRHKVRASDSVATLDEVLQHLEETATAKNSPAAA